MIQKNALLKIEDSILLSNGAAISISNNHCLYAESVNDSFILSFMKKYNLDRICYYKNKEGFYDSVIAFHKTYTPFLGNAETVSYDFGSSSSILRSKIKTGLTLKDQKLKIIDSLFLYQQNSKPAFGE